MQSLLAIAAVFATSVLAQSNQGVLSIGNLPSCGQTCSVLSAAAGGCNGASSSSQSIWSCFCQRVYAANPTAINTGTGLCSDTCSSTSDQQAAVSWFRTQCGSDNGASEHADSGSGTGSGSGGSNQAGTTSSSNSASSTPTSGSLAGSGDGNGITGENPSDDDWWADHYQWIVMLIVLVIGLSLIAAGLIWFKKRRQRRADRMSGGFNQGITSRSGGGGSGPRGGEMSGPHGPYGAGKDIASGSLVDASSRTDVDGTDSPMRTRDAFMPYGYGYTRSESRLGSRGNMTASPGLARASGDEISRAESGTPGTMGKSGSRRVLVRERSD